MNLVILKIGGSVITEKGSVSSAKKPEIERISHEIASFKKEADLDLILVHGAGSFGHPQAINWVKEGFDAKGVYLIHSSVNILNSMVLDSLNNAGVNALPVHPLSGSLLEDGRLIELQVEKIKLMLERGIVPVLHGDVVMDRKRGAAILSGDRIVPYLASVMNASQIGAGTDVDGVLDEKGTVIKKITPMSFIDMKKSIQGSGTTDVTGGMLGKVSEFLELAKKGISSRIFNASKKDMVSKFLYGEDVGTLITDK
ncbi:MAG: isopentenyl phosphate kinase family protein [Candidatus Methanoperedens sp.]|nr:isopentenyl phosphate kinase family protein [Candidatus Methanoperedens sp.]MCE8426859.1 isopentenyl phosphate kinase family protein [Candidatus Methanoperedens sp.]